MRNDIKTTFQGEVQFLAWGDGPAGPWIKVLLPDSEGLEPFRGMTAAKKGMVGQRLMCALVEINDDETPKVPEAPAPKGGALAKLAGMLCADPAFRDWFSSREWAVYTRGACPELKHKSDEDGTAQGIRHVCRVSSRADLDHDEDAAERFHALIRKPWAEFNGSKP